MKVHELCECFPSISKDKIERIMKCAERLGRNRRAISRETGFEVGLVFKVLKKAGVQTLHRHHIVDEARLRQMHATGATDHEIADLLNVPGSSVTSKRHRLGLRANVSPRWPQLSVGYRQERGYLEIASKRDSHSRYAVICHCPCSLQPHAVCKRVYVGHFKAHSVKSCGRVSSELFLNSEYARDRRAASSRSRDRREEILDGLSFQTCIVVHLCERGLRGLFKMNDRVLLGRNKEIDLVFPRRGEPQVMVEINERNHECTTRRTADCIKRDLAMFKFPLAKWVTINERSFLENPQAEIDRLTTVLKRKGIMLVSKSTE